MKTKILSGGVSVRGAAAGALVLALAACGADDGVEPRASNDEQGIGVQAGPGAALLARTTLSPTHRVEFWQEAGKEIAVIEDYAPDSGEESALSGFRNEAYAELYQKLAGGSADPDVLARLRAVDAAPRKPAASAQSRVAGEPTSDAPAGARTNTKSVAEDAKWFLEQICQPRSANIHPDRDLCWTQPLTPGWKQVTWNQPGWYLFQGSLFNAASSGNAQFTVAGTNPKLTKTISAAPRRVVRVNLTSDNGFSTVGSGESFAIYYSFID